MNDIDFFVAVQPFPLFDELLGDIDHHRMVGLHRAAAERRQQDIVGLAPVRLGGVRRKKPVARNRTHAPQRSANSLVEAFFIAQFVDEIEARHDHQRLAHHIKPEDRPKLFGHARQILDRR